MRAATKRARSRVRSPRLDRKTQQVTAFAQSRSGLWREYLAAFARGLATRLQTAWTSPRVIAARERVNGWQGEPSAGAALLLLGTAFITLLVLAIDRLAVPLPNPGVVYLPLIALLAYHWSWRLGALAGLAQLVCVYALFLAPADSLAKPLNARGAAQLLTLAAISVFTLLLVQFARTQRDTAAHQAGRAEALNIVGSSLTSELDEARLLRLIAQTARDLTGAGFAAFTLRPLDALGRSLGPVEDSRFHLAAVVGVTPEQEALFSRMPLGGEGLLAPIFRHGIPVRVTDALLMAHPAAHSAHSAHSAAAPTKAADRHSAASTQAHLRISRRAAARATATAYARGMLSAEELRAIGSPHGHPVVRSFLGVPLLDREGQVRGGLLLGHTEPGRFSVEDERLLTGLATQAMVALENARLYRAAQAQAQELDAIFDSISDAVLLVDDAGHVIRENRAASALAAEGAVDSAAMERVVRDAETAADALLNASKRSDMVVSAEAHTDIILTTDAAGEERQYAVTATPLRSTLASKGEIAWDGVASQAKSRSHAAPGAVVVWHDLTEARRLLRERQARAEADSRRALLQLMIDELPGGIYLVRGPQARLTLANRAAREVWGADWAEGQPMVEFLARRGVRILSPAGKPLAEEELATVRAVRSGEAVRHHQEIIRRPDGTTLPVLLNAVALDSEGLPFAGASRSGAPNGLVAAMEVESDVERELSALVVLQDVTALKEAERVKDEFITIAAHELKTPMAAVKGYTDMLRRRSVSSGSGEIAAREATGSAALASWQIDALETIDQATDRLVELTEDLLDVARLQANRVELRLEPHDLVALARRVAKRLQFSTERHTLTVESDTEYAVARLDVRRIEQVVGNLLNNAIKYSPEGGPILVSVREEVARGEVTLMVRDCGIGIPIEQQGRIFGRFARADNARAAGVSGTGLGLYLSRELVERHGGRIWFESAQGAGSAFSIALPLLLDDEDEEADDKAQAD